MIDPNLQSSASTQRVRTPADDELLEAATRGQIDRIDLALEQGADIHARDLVGNTALDLAILHSGNNEAVKRLIDAGADINGLDPAGRPPLHRFIIGKNAELAKYVVDRGASVSFSSDLDGLPLALASEQGQSEIVRILLAAKAAPNARDASGRTALHVACDVETVDTLISAGAQIRINGNDGESPLGYAALRGKVEVCRRLIELGAPVNAVNPGAGGLGPLAYASRAWVRSEDVAQILLEAGADMNERDHDGRTAVVNAAVNNRGECVRYLVTRGADPNSRLSNGITLLMLAASFNDVQTVTTLLERGADPGAISATDHSLLTEAKNRPAVMAAYNAWVARTAMRQFVTSPAPV